MCIRDRGTPDWAYPPFILASTAAALGWDVSIFFTFYGLNLLKKDISDLKVSPLGNPGMPMKMPFGPDWFKAVSYTHLRAHETVLDLVCRLLLENKKQTSRSDFYYSPK